MQVALGSILTFTASFWPIQKFGEDIQWLVLATQVIIWRGLKYVQFLHLLFDKLTSQLVWHTPIAKQTTGIYPGSDKCISSGRYILRWGRMWVSCFFNSPDKGARPLSKYWKQYGNQNKAMSEEELKITLGRIMCFLGKSINCLTNLGERAGRS